MSQIGINRPGESLVRVAAGERGKHGAVRIQRAVLVRQDGTTATKTPGDTILREQATAVSPAVTGTVGSNPTFSSGGGTGGKDVYSVPLGTGEGTDFAQGDFIRSTTGNGGVYEVDSVTGDTLKVFAGQNELDIGNGNTIETVTPEGVYGGTVEVSYSDLQGLNGTLEVVVQGLTSSVRNNKPAVATEFRDRKLDVFWPEAAASSSVKVY